MKTLKDGTQVPSRMWYYLLDYLDHHEEGIVPRLSNMNKDEFLEIFDKATSFDKGNLK